MKLPKWKWWQWALAIFFGLILIGSINRCIDPEGITTASAPPATPSKPQDPLDDLKKRHRDWQNVNLSAGVLHVEAKVMGLHEAARDVTTIGEWLEKHPSVIVERLEYAPTLTAVDRLGAESQVGLFVATFQATDLRAAKFGNLTHASILGLATTVRAGSPVGLQEIAKWCSDPTNLEFTGIDFCKAVMG